MSGDNSTGEAAGSGASITWKFVFFWLLSAIVPAVFYVACFLALAAYMGVLTGAEAIALLSPAIWLLVGLCQFSLLRRRLRRGGAWIWATFAGGVVGHIAGGLIRIFAEPYFEELLIRGELTGGGVAPWAYSVYPLVPLVVASVVNLALVAVLQSLCFDKGMGGRAVWILAAILAGILGPICVMLLGWNLLGFLATFRLIEFLPDWFPATLTTAPLAPIVNLAIYGLLTGLVMRWILNRRASQQAKAIVGHFE